MSKLNEGTRLVRNVLQTEATPSGKTFLGASGFKRDARTELFFRTTTVFAGEGSFHESAETNDKRNIALIRELAVTDWAWCCDFLPWLRLGGNIRTAPVMLAAHAADARAKDHQGGSPLTTREVVGLVLQRGDEPTEILQYCLKTFGRIPAAVKRGAADAMLRLWRERAVIRYDKPERAMRFADAIELAHPDPRDEYQSALFGYLLNERHHTGGPIPDGLHAITLRRNLSQQDPAARHGLAAQALDSPDGMASGWIRLASAGQWEWVKSWLGDSCDTALSERQVWELVVPWMGYMALLRNLRNFDQAGVRDRVADAVGQRLISEAATSRQLPFRFLTAWLNAPSMRWGRYLEKALEACLPNVPAMKGRGLILIDMSGSMQYELSAREVGVRPGQPRPKRPQRVQAAALFAMALAIRNPGNVDVYGFADSHFMVKDNLDASASVLRAVETVMGAVGSVGGGTRIEQNLRQVFRADRHDWVAIFSDEQTLPSGPGWDSYRAHWLGIGDITSALPPRVPVYAWNLAGSTYGAMATTGSHYALAGLTDASFGIMARLEQGRSGVWPWDLPEVHVDPDEDDG